MYDYPGISDPGKELLNAFGSSLCVDREKLLLTEIGERKFKDSPELEVFHRVYDWFSDRLHIGFMDDIGTDEELMKVSEHLSRYGTDVGSARYVLNEDAGFGIQDTDRLKRLLEGKKCLSGPGYRITLENGSLKMYTVRTRHGPDDTEFSFQEESNGTQSAFRLCSTLFENGLKDSTIVLDDFGSSMHPVLIKKMMTDYLKTCKDSDNQLIIATHHAGLMTLDLFRRDEIWFVEKRSGMSEIYSLDDFGPNDRIYAHLQKAYLEGRFGALPVCRGPDTE